LELAMSALVCRYVSSRVARLARRAILSLAVWGGLSGVVAAQGFQAPQPGYFLAFPAFYDGDYVATGAGMLTFLQGAIKNPAAGSFWIDAICYETMRGECNFHMGNHLAAYQCYNNALELIIKFNNWMLSVQFPPVVTPAPPQQLTPIPWHVTQRKTVIGGYPPTMNIMQGQINNANAIVNGGVVQQAILVPIYAQEIVRCSCLAIRRWRELLGPASPHSNVTNRLVQALAGRPALPNHWSEAWIDVELGLAYAAAGKDTQARKILEKAELAAGMFDHPFTGTVHLELGRLDFAAGNYQMAQQHFLEASWAAANYKDFGVVEEALRYGALTHALTNGNQPYLPLVGATAWASAQGLVQLQASLLLSSAENASMMNQPEIAAGLLNQATVLTAHCDLPRGKLGARMNHLKSLASYQLARVADGDFALAAAMTFQSLGSLWLYHIGLVDLLWAEKDITERTAVDLYTTLLRDPTPNDWLVDPLESLTVLSIPHPLSYENWFDAALVRKNKEHERALEIADMARRHRFLTTLDEGGRLLNLRWLLEAPRGALDETALLQRQAILTRYPAYNQKSVEAKRLRSELRKLPLMPDVDDQETIDQQAQLLSALATVSGEQEVLLRQISVRREAGNIVFPPMRTFKQTQESLEDGQSLLAFFTASRYTYGFLLSKDKYHYWEIKPNKRFAGHLAGMLRGWGNWEQNKELKLDELTSGAWKAPAQEVMNALVTKSSKADFTRTLDELVIVPDGMLWYIPFEALPASKGASAEPLLNRVRVRYAPTVGLALGDTRRRRTDGNMAVVLGHLYPRDEIGVVKSGFDSITRVMPEAVALEGKLPAPGALYGSLIDRLIVLNEVTPPSTGYDWSPLPNDAKSPSSPLAQWFSLPFSGPEQVMLPGFRTQAERAMKTGGDGSDLFLATCGLMANGARTVLISRWRTGGQSSIDLVREFAQELPHTTASDAWQRSVQLVSNSQVNAAAEPRLKLTLKDTPPNADQPFFWAGFLLADTGALPMTDEEEEAAEQVLVAKPAEEKPGEDKAADNKAGEMKPDGKGAAERVVGNPPAGQDDKVAAKEPVNAAVDPPADPAADMSAGARKPPKAKRVRPPAAERKKPSEKTKRGAV
jgi:tetratricopeptide (TPR) repeat protein